jgi:hypothetical protein
VADGPVIQAAGGAGAGGRARVDDSFDLDPRPAGTTPAVADRILT